MYKKLHGNKWLCIEPEKLFTDGVEDGNIVLNKHKYPEEYIDVYYTGNKVLSEAMSNASLSKGFHKIVISEKEPVGAIV